jgi:hypothetical protein
LPHDGRIVVRECLGVGCSGVRNDAWTAVAVVRVGDPGNE